jgi:hypothetical protein
MTAIAGHKNVDTPFAGEVVEVRAEYDFAKDGGATGALDIFTALGEVIIESFHFKVLTACTSGGSMTMDVGVTGNLDQFQDGVAVAALTLNSVKFPPVVDGTPNVIAVPHVLATGEKVVQTILAETLTAGKIQYVMRYRKA